MQTKLYVDMNANQWPIIYRSEYNIRFAKLESMHPFDSCKWGRVFKILKEGKLINENSVVTPNEATKTDLLVTHDKKYLRSLKCSIKVAQIAEVVPLILVPSCFTNKCLLRPMRFQTGGSILAGKLALEKGFAINIGGGFHHCNSKDGSGFCFYADITLLIQFLFHHYSDTVKNVMIIDLDAHQGNGYARDFSGNHNVYILDIYNKEIYPKDKEAKLAINNKVELKSFTEDDEYLDLVKTNINKSLLEFKPDLVVYNAGTDVLENDPLGNMSVTLDGVIARDELVFRAVRAHGIPIVMLTSGGYTRKSADAIAQSIFNLSQQGLIHGPRPQSLEKAFVPKLGTFSTPSFTETISVNIQSEL